MKEKSGISAAREEMTVRTLERPSPPQPFIILRIPIASLSAVLDVEAVVGISQLVGGNVHLEVLMGVLDDLNAFASGCGGSSWLQVVAHNIFDPIEQRGRLWTHSHGTVEGWRALSRDPSAWHCVPSNTNLKAAVYEYVMPPNTSVTVPRLCLRQELSASSLGIEARRASEKFMDALMRRDHDRCIVSHITADDITLIASHIVPRRLGHLVKAITERYVRTAAPPIIDKWDPRIGFVLNASLGVIFDRFDAGFFRDPSNPAKGYIVHIFPKGLKNMVQGSLFGQLGPVQYPLPASELSSPSSPLTYDDLGDEDGPQSERDLDNNNDGEPTDTNDLPDEFPPAGLFAWHYTQCMLKRFATAQFRGLEQAFFLETPSRYRGDSDDESDWEIPCTSPTPHSAYPMQAFDMVMAQDELRREVGDCVRQATKDEIDGSSLV